MTQNWDLPPDGTDILGTAIKTTLPDAIESVRSMFSGASEPTATVAYMLWADTTSGLIKQRNAANDGWNIIGPLGGIQSRETVKSEILAMSATAARRVFVPGAAFEVQRVALVPDTASSSSSGNEWTFMLRNMTQSLDLFSGTVGTFTALAGVGGGSELAVDTAYELLVDQNGTIAADDVLRFTATEVGSATTIAELQIFVEGYYVG